MKHTIAFLDSTRVLAAQGGFVFLTFPNAMVDQRLVENSGTKEIPVADKAGLALISLTCRS